MANLINRIVIVGGGSAGWLTAGVIAAEHIKNSSSGREVLLIESPDISPIGVGEGTWPSMRTTLESMGVSETDFIRECDASFKQGSKFSKWTYGKDDAYYHPFTLPTGYGEINLAPVWQQFKERMSFADAVCVQSHLCDKGLAPKQITTPEYAAIANYGYHLDAGKFSVFLHKHCVEKLGVTYIRDNVVSINSNENGDIASLGTESHGDIQGDLFIDCTGLSSLLIGKHYQVPFINRKEILFNDTALAVQIPYSAADNSIASHTLSTAQQAGWIWDIGLPTRRGVGHVFSSAHISADEAEKQLRKYIEPTIGQRESESISIRKIKINPGHREIFWYKNCVAVGMAAGFIEPLEASALVLVELSAKMISEQMPANRNTMDVVAKRFNESFTHRWKRIIDFLKLHYVLTKRTDSDYWLDNIQASTIPQSLQDLIALWRFQSPWSYDEIHKEEMFPSASFQYVLYGMQFETEIKLEDRKSGLMSLKKAEGYFTENAKKTHQLVNALSSNRELIEKIKTFGLQKI